MATLRPFAHIRLRLGWSHNTAAIRLGCSPGYLRTLESARGPLPMEFARRMAAEYGVTVNELFLTPTAGDGAPVNREGEARRVETAASPRRAA